MDLIDFKPENSKISNIIIFIIMIGLCLWLVFSLCDKRIRAIEKEVIKETVNGITS